MSQPTGTDRSANKEKTSRRKFVWQLIFSSGIVIAVFFLVVWVLYPGFTGLLENSPIPGDKSISLDSFTGLVTLAVVSGGFLFWVIDRRQKELAEAAREQSLSFQLFQTIHDRLVNPDQEKARRWILSHIPIKQPDQPLEDWYAQITPIIEARPSSWDHSRSPGQIYIKQVLNNFDFIGFVSEHFWNSRETDVEWISPPVAKVWERIGPYVQHLSEQRQEPDYYRAARQFGEYCIKFRQQKGLPPSRYFEGL